MSMLVLIMLVLVMLVLVMLVISKTKGSCYISYSFRIFMMSGPQILSVCKRRIYKMNMDIL